MKLIQVALSLPRLDNDLRYQVVCASNALLSVTLTYVKRNEQQNPLHFTAFPFYHFCFLCCSLNVVLSYPIT